MKTTILSIILLTLITGFIEAQKISEWRPENRTGISAEKGLLKLWPEPGPQMLWSNQELPSGFSSPTFGNGSVYLTGNKDKSDILVAMDSLGKIKWQTPYGSSWNESYPDSRCTPTVEGNRVYVSSGSGELACIDGNSGAIPEKFDLISSFKISKGSGPYWAHPVIHNGKLYVRHGKVLMAYDIKNK